MDPVLERRRARHAERRAAAAARQAAMQRVGELQPRVDERGADALDELEQQAAVAHAAHLREAWTLRDQIRARRDALSSAPETVAAQSDNDATEAHPDDIEDGAGEDREHDDPSGDVDARDAA